jgi:hypothetical protein
MMEGFAKRLNQMVASSVEAVPAQLPVVSSSQEQAITPIEQEVNPSADYEDLEREDILAALAFAACLSQVKRLELVDA